MSKSLIHNQLPECSICCEEIENTSWVCETDCNHIYHYDCMLNWVEACKQSFSGKLSCPNCREPINKELEKTVFCTPEQIEHVDKIVTRIHNDPEAQKLINSLLKIYS